MRKYYVLAFLLLQGMLVFAQNNYKLGYVIALRGDTLYGEIDYRNNHAMMRICRFKVNDSITEFTPNDIVAYRFIEGKYFVSREIDGKKYFLEFLLKGQLNLYALGNLYYIEKENEPLTLLPYKKGTYKQDDKEYFIKPTQLKGKLVYFTQDAPQLKPEIERIQAPTHQNLIKIAKEYHNIVCTTGEECIVFEKKLPPVRIKTGIIVQGYKPSGEHAIVGYYGALLHVGMPRVSENLYFKTGFITGESKAERLYKMPLQFEYIFYPKWKVRPFVAGGGYLYFNKYRELIPAYVGGLLYATRNGKFSASFYYELETEPLIFFIPSFNLMGHSLTLGISYTF